MTEVLEGTISHYRILGLLGEGGMGAVYRARDERLARDLAIKVLRAESLHDVGAKARLLREAQMASSLNHPHIGHVYEVGEDRGYVYIAMELIEGRTLAKSIPTGGLAPEALLRLGLQISDAVGYAHEQGVIHRDLKSANIMLTSEQRVKILDFGLAKRVEGQAQQAGTSALTLTETGVVMGTPNHMPPEVLLGEPADSRGDVWALGVVLYEMASGKFPFTAPSMFALADSIVHGSPEPLPEHVPAGIRAVIARCLAREPSQRYRRASEVRAALEALTGAGAPKAPFLPRRAWLTAAALGALALAAVLVLMPGGLRDLVTGAAGGPHIRSLAVLPLLNLSGDPAQEYFADGMTEELITDLAPIHSLKVISRTSVMRFKGSTKPLREIAMALGVDAVVEGSVMRVGDRVRITAQLIEASSDRHLWARSFERDVKDVLALQGEVARDIAQEIRLQVTPEVSERLSGKRPINPEAYEEYLKGRFEWKKLTNDGVRSGLEHFERARALDPGDARYSSALADAYLVLVQLIGSVPPQAGFAKVEDYARQALAADESSAEAHASMAAAMFFGEWNWSEAEKHVKRAIELNAGYSGAHLVYSTMLTAVGRVDEAVEQDRLALELDPFSLIIHWNAISTLYMGRRYDAALAQARRADEFAPGSNLVQGSTIRIYEQTGDYAKALGVMEHYLPEADGGKALAAKMRRAWETSGPEGYWKAVLEYFEDPRRTKTVTNERRAMIYTRVGDRDRAFETLERSLAEHSGDMLFIRTEPAFDTLHDDPRFKELVRKVGLP